MFRICIKIFDLFILLRASRCSSYFIDFEKLQDTPEQGILHFVECTNEINESLKELHKEFLKTSSLKECSSILRRIKESGEKEFLVKILKCNTRYKYNLFLNICL
ncbi:hypothetical protein H312_00567 [Anncaliia algerae PRA339]|uniref:Uncharacterized protein n=1 Tax=Anncaliia algerae PRA339 TaxID=1288291 RepID=A0A059F536_9MICR|nr:hypothetical protein H312_00567 [Anncaliia algerae PRA339]